MLQIYLFGTARVLKPRVLSPKGALSDATSFQAGTQRLSTFQSIERAFRHSATNRSTWPILLWTHFKVVMLVLLALPQAASHPKPGIKRECQVRQRGGASG